MVVAAGREMSTRLRRGADQVAFAPHRRLPHGVQVSGPCPPGAGADDRALAPEPVDDAERAWPVDLAAEQA